MPILDAFGRPYGPNNPAPEPQTTGTIAELERTRARGLDGAKALFTQVEKSGREMSALEQTLFEQQMDEVTDLGKQIDQRRLDDQRRALEEAERPSDYQRGLVRHVKGQPGQTSRTSPSQALRTTLPDQIGAMQHPALRELGAGAGRDMRTMFGAPTPSGFARPLDFFLAVTWGMSHDALQSYAAMDHGGTTGGFLVPTEYAYMVLDSALGMEVVRPLADTRPMQTSTLQVACYDGMDQDPLTQLYGVSFQWLAENETATPSTARVRALQLIAKLGGCYVAASNELAADAPGFETNLADRLIHAVSANLDRFFLMGSGSAQPLGALVSPAAMTVVRESGQTTPINLNNLSAMFAANARPMSSVWVCSPTCLPSLLSLTYAPSGSGSSVVAQAPDGTMTILTRPLLVTPSLPTVANTRTLAFCDFSYYAIGMRKEIGFERSAHVAFTTNQTVYRVLVRVDGQPKISAPYVGSDAQQYSPFVVLGPTVP